MSMLYNTPRGATYDPLVVELWWWNGDRPVGRLEASEKVEVTWTDRGVGTVVIDTPLSDVSRMLLEPAGEVLVVVSMNGLRHVSTVVEATVFAEEDSPHDVRVKATTASAWSMLAGQCIPPDPDVPLSQQRDGAVFSMTGPVETVVKRLVSAGARRVGHPILTAPDQGRGPVVTVTSNNDPVSELVEGILSGTGYRLSLDGWLPGDDQDGDQVLSRPTIVADVVPYRQVAGLVWSALSEELGDWELTYSRAAKTRLVVELGGEQDVPRSLFEAISPWEGRSPWARREAHFKPSKTGDNGDQVAEIVEEAAKTELLKSAPQTSLDASSAPAMSWEFGVDGGFARQYQVGDWVMVDLPGVGRVEQVVTEVKVELTPVSLTVTPKVSTPDTRENDLYAAVAELSRRVDAQDRR